MLKLKCLWALLLLASVGIPVPPARGSQDARPVKTIKKAKRKNRPQLIPLTNLNVPTASGSVFTSVALVQSWVSPVDSGASRILDGLYLGSFDDALNRDFLLENKITHILNCAKECTRSDKEVAEIFKKDGISVINLPQLNPHNQDPDYQEGIFDGADAKIHLYLDDAADMIDSHIQAGRSVLVHCSKGISRSSTIVIYFLMKKHGKTLDEAYEFVSRQRPVIDPNLGFALLLESLEKNLFPEIHIRDASPAG